jgi:hypothetical protein
MKSTRTSVNTVMAQRRFDPVTSRMPVGIAESTRRPELWAHVRPLVAPQSVKVTSTGNCNKQKPTLAAVRPVQRRSLGWLMKWKGCGSKWLSPNRGTIQANWKNTGNPARVPFFKCIISRIQVHRLSPDQPASEAGMYDRCRLYL